MNKKLLYSFIIMAVIISLSVGFIYLIPDDKATIESYLNSGGIIKQSESYEEPQLQTDIPFWTPGMNMPAPTRYHGSGVGYSRNDTNWLLCFGGDQDGSGNNSSVVSIYNATTNSWSTGAPCPPTLVFYATASRLGNICYLIGGIGPGGAFTSEANEVKRYNFAANTWLTNAANYPIQIAFGGQGSASYQDSLIYAVGGLGNGTSNAVNNVYLYNANSNTWRACSPIPIPVWGGACAISGDTIIYVCGAPTYSGVGTNTVYRGLIIQSDRSLISWNTTGQLYPGPSRIRMGGASWGCKGIIVGIGCSSGFSTQTDVQVYSPGANTWSSQPSYPVSTACAFFASSPKTGNTWKLMVASGLILMPPYSIPNVNVMTDTLCAVPAPIQSTLCRNLGFNRPIVNLTTIRDTIIFSGNQTCSITDVNVRIDTVLHTFDSDMVFTLRHASTTLPLITNRGGGGDNFIRTVLDDSALLPISSGTAPFTGSYRPEQPLNAFNNIPPTGQWILEIGDFVGGDSGYLKAWCMVISYTCPTGGIQTIEVPFSYRLSQNYPNPFNPMTTIKYGLPKSGNTRLVVYDILGRIVITLVNEFKDSGTYNVSFDGTNLASGIYFYSLESSSYKETRKMLLLK